MTNINNNKIVKYFSLWLFSVIEWMKCGKNSFRGLFVHHLWDHIYISTSNAVGASTLSLWDHVQKDNKEKQNMLLIKIVSMGRLVNIFFAPCERQYMLVVMCNEGDGDGHKAFLINVKYGLIYSWDWDIAIQATDTHGPAPLEFIRRRTRSTRILS